jgi:hypothetical protein
MKSTEHFKNTIREYLDKTADEDALFAVTYAKAGKNMDGCISYILHTVKNSGCNGFSDSEIYSLALHYWDEDGIEPCKPFNFRAVVNHQIELTEEEKKQAHQDALLRLQNEAYEKLKQPKNSSRKPAAEHQCQPILF